MHGHVSYGLQIQSTIRLHLPEARVERADVTVERGSVPRPRPDQRPDGDGCWAATPDQALYYWPEAGAFAVEGGSRIVVDPDDGVLDDSVRFSVEGPLLATALHQRGGLVLHASAVTWGDGAIAVAAHSGTGKSTTAGALVRRGAAPLTDDLVALDVAGTPTVSPGGVGLKLWPASAQALGHDIDAMPTVGETGVKRRWLLAPDLAPRPLHHLIVLTSGDAVSVERLPPSLAVLEVMGRSYCSEMLRLQDGARNLADVSTLVRAVPVWLATRGPDLDSLDSLVDALEAALALPRADEPRHAVSDPS